MLKREYNQGVRYRHQIRGYHTECNHSCINSHSYWNQSTLYVRFTLRPYRLFTPRKYTHWIHIQVNPYRSWIKFEIYYQFVNRSVFHISAKPVANARQNKRAKEESTRKNYTVSLRRVDWKCIGSTGVSVYLSSQHRGLLELLHFKNTTGAQRRVRSVCNKSWWVGNLISDSNRHAWPVYVLSVAAALPSPWIKNQFRLSAQYRQRSALLNTV